MVALRSSLKPTLTNELRFGLNRGISIFRGEIAPNMFSQWKGYYPTMGYVSPVASVSGSSRRTAPVRELHDNVSLLKGSHMLTFGVDISQFNLWYQTVGTSVIPQMSFSGLQSGDPVNTGSTGIFTTANFPGASSTNLADARNMYALMTGRIASISRSVAYNGTSYGPTVPTERDRQWEWGAFVQDTWRITPGFTLNLGMRFQVQKPFDNQNNVYSAVSYQSAWGISGVGNMYKPGTMTGINPTFDKYKSGYYSIPKSWNPSIGFAWQLPGLDGPLGLLLGREKGKSVLRAGYGISTIREGSYTFQSLFGSNQGLTYSTSLDPINYPSDFGAPGSRLLRDSSFPSRAYPNAPAYPLTPAVSNSLNAYDPNLKMGYVQSWNIGFQRELSKNTVVEVRYTGNHGLKEWRQINLNEVNTIENGFLKEFAVAQNNLFINRGCSGSWTNCTNPNSTSFANAGIAGQGAIPMISTGLGYTSDATTSDYLRQNRAGNVAYNIYRSTAGMQRLVTAGYPANLFVVNPAVPSGGSYLLTNMGASYYNSLQIELNRRMAGGLLLQGSYAFSKSLMNGNTSDYGDYNQPTTFRNLGLDRTPGAGDIRNAFKLNGIYELPFGQGQRFLAGANRVVNKVIGGWELAGISRVQSGGPFQLTSNGRYGMNTSENGVVLNNISLSQLQDMVQIRKTTGADGKGLVYWLPDSIIANTNAAFETNGKNWNNLNASQPYVGPQLASGQLGYRIYLRNPWQYHFDVNVIKRTKITERANVEFKATFLNILNMTNFFLANAPNNAVLRPDHLRLPGLFGRRRPRLARYRVPVARELLAQADNPNIATGRASACPVFLLCFRRRRPPRLAPAGAQARRERRTTANYRHSAANIFFLCLLGRTGPPRFCCCCARRWISWPSTRSGRSGTRARPIVPITTASVAAGSSRLPRRPCSRRPPPSAHSSPFVPKIRHPCRAPLPITLPARRRPSAIVREVSRGGVYVWKVQPSDRRRAVCGRMLTGSGA